MRLSCADLLSEFESRRTLTNPTIIKLNKQIFFESNNNIIPVQKVLRSSCYFSNRINNISIFQPKLIRVHPSNIKNQLHNIIRLTHTLNKHCTPSFQSNELNISNVLNYTNKYCPKYNEINALVSSNYTHNEHVDDNDNNNDFIKEYTNYNEVSKECVDYINNVVSEKINNGVGTKVNNKENRKKKAESKNKSKSKSKIKKSKDAFNYDEEEVINYLSNKIRNKFKYNNEYSHLFSKNRKEGNVKRMKNKNQNYLKNIFKKDNGKDKMKLQSKSFDNILSPTIDGKNNFE
jgi:hypothetical protein